MFELADSINVNIRMDKDLKDQADAFFNELGLNMSSAVNIFVRQSLRQGKIPFELSLTPNTRTVSAIEDGDVDITALVKHPSAEIEGI